MPELTYELVAPLVSETDVSSHHVQVVFRCPVSDELVRANGKVTESHGAAVKNEVKRSIWRNMRWGLSRMMYSVFGYGIGGAAASTLVDAAGAVGDGNRPSEAQVKDAIVDAFRSVGNRFAWDESNQRFVSAKVFKDLQTEFTVIVQQVALTQAWDRSVLARMLAEIAAADGSLAEEERVFFDGFLRGESLDNLLEKPPLTKADLEETSQEARHVMWLLAAAMAVSDEDFAATEQKKLAFFGGALGVAPNDQTRGLELAKEYVLDQALEAAYGDGRLDKAEQQHVMQLAAKLGIPEDRAARLDARCRKRKGIL